MTPPLIAFVALALLATLLVTGLLLRPLLVSAPAGGGMPPPRRLPWALAVLTALAASSLYVRIGSPRILMATPEPPAHQLNEVDMAAAVEGLAQRLQAQPDDLQGWFMLARSYQAMERWPQAASAYRQALRLSPGDADLLADLADVVATAQGGALQGEPRRLVDQALKADPDHAKSLALAAMDEFRQGRLEKASAYWERLVATQPENAEAAQWARQGLARVRAALAARTGRTTP